MKSIKNIFDPFLKQALAHKKFFKINNYLVELGNHGLGILNYGDMNITGEKKLMEKLAEYYGKKKTVIVDVGANIGKYSTLAKSTFPNSDIYALEPHPNSYKKLEQKSREYDFTPINLGLGNKKGKTKIFDDSESDGSEAASIYKDVIEDKGKHKSISHIISIDTLDNIWYTFLKKRKINLLKIDTEGSEYLVLLGSKKALLSNNIDFIHFKFNEMNVVSRVFMKDFFELLENYKLYRLLPDGLLPINEYYPLNCELFAYQNTRNK